MKRILFVCDSLQEKGGVEKLVALQANHFRAQGHDVRIATRYRQHKPAAYPLEDGIRVMSFDWDIETTGLTKLSRFPGFLFWIRQQVNAFDPDDILTNGLNVGVLAILGNASRRSRVVACDHNHFGNATAFWSFLRRFAYKDIRAVVSLTQEDLPRYRAINARAVCIYNPVDLPDGQQGFARNRQVLAVGRHTLQKGFDLLLDAWARVREKHPDWSLTIVGEGEQTPKLQQQIRTLGIADSVNLHPFSDNISQYYLNSNLFVLSSRFEGFCLVMIEALSVGLPVVAFNCKTGPQEVLEQGGGLLVEAENVAKLAGAICAFIEQPETWDALSQAGMKNAARFTNENYFASWDGLLK